MLNRRDFLTNTAWGFGGLAAQAMLHTEDARAEQVQATASGGVWKTDDSGETIRPVFEQGASTSIGDVTVAPSNPNIVWIGGGEANIFRSSMAGSGVYKSTDAGETWQHMGLEGTYTIPRIIIHPDDPDIVYVASSGHEWSHNPERGVYVTRDGGRSWARSGYDRGHRDRIGGGHVL